MPVTATDWRELFAGLAESDCKFLQRADSGKISHEIWGAIAKLQIFRAIRVGITGRDLCPCDLWIVFDIAVEFGKAKAQQKRSMAAMDGISPCHQQRKDAQALQDLFGQVRSHGSAASLFS
ncbi:MAG: hypothetical protein HUJ27_10065 [Rhodobacteraceae bacterium]|nr:hypothetical protein [Paracoccaceae bacterium]